MFTDIIFKKYLYNWRNSEQVLVILYLMLITMCNESDQLIY